ncbi:MAG: glycosyltransferase family 39 protein [Ktedonobacteraceae bacterium]|nr:glycosyltransferase family 39 protein [Ktedonobacteraceae bacterium]
MAMKVPLAQVKPSTGRESQPSAARGVVAGAWYRYWECYLIFLVAAVLRFYRVDTSQFEGDQVLLFRMAYDAVHHGLLPVTDSTSSLGFANPPGLLYLYMLPAALSDNPLLAVLLNSLFAVAAVLATYIFVTRYYGRFAGTVAGLLYATAPVPLIYSRFIWQPNMMQLFVILFFFALYRGVVERRKGWLPLAATWLAILLQMHLTALSLLVPLLLALLFAPETQRWRDLGYAGIALAVIFSPYLLWELVTNFGDIAIVHAVLQAQACHRANACIDGDSWSSYLTFLGASDPKQAPLNPHSWVHTLALPLYWLSQGLLYSVIGGFIAALGLASSWWWRSARSGNDNQEESERRATLPWLQRWLRLAPPASACGLLLLCVWQVLPLLITARHTLPLFTHYLLVTIPGPFMFVGLFLELLRRWVSRPRQTPWLVAHSLLYSATVLLLLLQGIGGTALVIDDTQGHFNDSNLYIYFSDLHSYQNAFSELDHLAQQRHLSRVYVATDLSTEQAMYYFSRQLQTPVTVFDAAHCLVLPNPASGPALLLTPPSTHLTYALLGRFASARLLAQPPILGGAPFRIYQLSSSTGPEQAQAVFGRDMRFSTPQVQWFPFDDTSRLVSQGDWLRALPPAYETYYRYQVTALPDTANTQGMQSVCTFNAMRAGDRLLVAFDLSGQSPLPRTVTLSVGYSVLTQDMPSFGPLRLMTHRHLESPYVPLKQDG